jgi:hypothetical protein
VFSRPEINTWVEVSFLLIFLSYALHMHITRGNTDGAARVLITGLVLFDLSAFDWSARNLLEVSRTGVNHLDRLLSTKGAVAFLKSQPGLFRVEIPIDLQPNIGDPFAISTTTGSGATMSNEFARLQGHPNLLNVRYRLMPASASEPRAVYQDPAWKVYEVPRGLPRAWVVHEELVEPSPQRALTLLESSGFDPSQTAVLDAPVPLDPVVEGAREQVTFLNMELRRLKLNVMTSSNGLLVLSEMYYPDWFATVNGHPARIYRADSGLRGVAIPRGANQVIL